MTVDIGSVQEQEAELGKHKPGEDKEEDGFDDQEILEMALELQKREDRFSPNENAFSKESLDSFNAQQVRAMKAAPMTPGARTSGAATSPQRGNGRSRTPAPRRAPATPAPSQIASPARRKPKTSAADEKPKRRATKKPGGAASDFAETQDTQAATTAAASEQAERLSDLENGEEAGDVAADGKTGEAEEEDESESISLDLSIETVTVKQLEILRSDGGILLAKPDVQGVTAEKWSAMIKTLAEPLGHLLSLLSGGKVKDQEVKSGASSIRKKAAGAPKKCGMKPGADATRLVAKLKTLASLMDDLKTFRAKVCSPKGVMDGQELQAQVEAIWKGWDSLGADIQLIKSDGEIVKRTVKYVSFPDLWVRAWISRDLNSDSNSSSV